MFSRKPGRRRIGRNDPCPCGSSQKYKRCHGRLDSSSAGPVGEDAEREAFIRQATQEHRAREVQEQRQQGLGRAIVSTAFKGYRVVAVGNRLYTSDKWKTFHDFLVEYVKLAFGKEWWLSEVIKEGDAMHPVILWSKLTYELQKASILTPGEIVSTVPNGAAMAYLNLGYDLYCVAHNDKVQERLLHRLKDIQHFWGARYELWVAAVLFRAGFDVEFIDESDRSSTHCEFVATYKKSQRKFSVEAKFRVGTKYRTGRHLCRALSKFAEHERIIFLDVNMPNMMGESVTVLPEFLESALESIRKFEGKTVNGTALPPAYLFITNQPNHHHLSSTNVRGGAVMEGFQIDEFKPGRTFAGIRLALEARERHQEVFAIGNSLREHHTIPATFDGEIEEYAFQSGARRFTVGKEVAVDVGGARRTGTLTTGMVDEARNIAHLGVWFPDDGSVGVVPVPLTDVEMAAWRRHPGTFFGIVQRQGQTIDDPLDAFDFFFNAYQQTPKDRLLSFFADSPNLAGLSCLSQQALAREYAIRCAEFVFARNNKNGVIPQGGNDSAAQ